MFELATNNVPQKFRGNTDISQHTASLNFVRNLQDADKDLHSAIKLALQDKCSNIVAGVPGDRGFELLRLLAF